MIWSLPGTSIARRGRILVERVGPNYRRRRHPTGDASRIANSLTPTQIDQNNESDY
jgi:hypothetical protein